MADRLLADGHEVLVVGTPNGPEARLAHEAGLLFHALRARGFDRSRPLSLLPAVAVLISSTVHAWRLLHRTRPQVVVGFGGYVSLPVGFASRMRGIPLVLHEQNSVPGMANRLLSRWARAIAVTYPRSVSRLGDGGRVTVTGNPVRAEVLNADRDSARKALKLSSKAVLLLVFGGSRGARHLNEAMIATRDRLLLQPDVRVMHVAGHAEAESVRAAVKDSGGDAGGRYMVLDYIEDMGSALAAADVVVARAGATSIAEITAVGRASVLVPYPYATEDHQTLNARDVESIGGAIMVADSELDGARFAEAIEELISNPEKRERMASAALELGMPDATERLADLIVECGSERGSEHRA